LFQIIETLCKGEGGPADAAVCTESEAVTEIQEIQKELQESLRKGPGEPADVAARTDSDAVTEIERIQKELEDIDGQIDTLHARRMLLHKDLASKVRELFDEKHALTSMSS